MRPHYAAGALLLSAVLTRPPAAARVQPPAVGPDTVTLSPGDATLRLRRVRLATDTIVVLVTPRDSGEHLAAMLIRRIERVTVGSADVFRETQRYTMPDGSWEVDTLDVSAETLALQRIVEASAHATNDLRVDGTRIVGTVTTDSGPRAADTPLVPLFHDMMTEAFVGAYPLDSGTTVIVPEFRPPSLAVRPAPMTVIGSAVVRTIGGPVDCLVIQGPRTATRWIARADGRLVRLRWTLPNGTTVWKLPQHDVVLPRPASVARI